MKRIAIYSRKSKETDTGESIKNQIKMCEDYFKRQDEECIFEIFQDEGFTGGNVDRPSFQRMLLLAKRKQFDIVACYKVDRLVRNIIEFFKIFDILEQSNVKLVSISEGFDPDTPGGRIMMTMLAGFAEMERMNIAQRVKDNMTALAKIGRWSGGTPPSGYKSIKAENGTKIAMYLELIPEWRSKIEFIFKNVAEGHTVTHVATLLNIPSKTVVNIINNPAYCKSDSLSKKYLESLGYKVFGELNGFGYLAYNRRPRAKSGKKLFNADGMFVAVSKHEALIDSTLWILANQKMKKRGEEAKPRISQFSFLAHLVKCKCGTGMSVTPGNRRKNGNRTYYFACSGQKSNKSSACDTGWVRSDYLEADILEMLQEAAINRNVLEKYISKKTDRNIENEIKELKKLIKINDLKLNGLTEKLVLFEGSAVNVVINKMNEVSKVNDTLNQDLFTLERENLLDTIDSTNIDILQSNIQRLLTVWDELDMETKQREICNIIKKISWDGEKDFHVSFNI